MATSQDAQCDVSKFGFAKTFILPALLIFVVPIVSFVFFRHAQTRYDDRIREAALNDIRADRSLSAADREKAIEFFTAVPASQLAKHDVAAQFLTRRTRLNLGTFRWAIRLSALSILGGVAVFLFAGVCVVLSLHSNLVQYLTLATGWHVLRIYGALQVVIQGALLVALSFWGTALWFERFSPKLILIVALVAVGAVALVLLAIFKRPDTTFEVEGVVLAPEKAAPLWGELHTLCNQVGTAPPDQIVAGIDDNFFVTEQPVTVAGQTLRGRTLFVSLALLKQLNGREANAVLAHEMAHFSGQDTVYSKKISPLLCRYGNYLEALQQGGITLPVFYFMLCFRAFFELSLRRLGRQREFRADQIAAEAASPEAFAVALLRIVAYSKYRRQIEQKFFDQERALETADIGRQVEGGFPAFAASFTANPALDSERMPHPFDSHPPLLQRLSAIAAGFNPDTAVALLTTPGDGRWYGDIGDAEELERQQWDSFEQRFREFHEKTLPYRFLPESDEERAIVVAAFPEVSFGDSPETLTLDHEKLHHASWPEPMPFAEIEGFALDDNGVLTVKHVAGKRQNQKIKTKQFGAAKQQVLEAINQYYGRYHAAVEYRKQKLAAAEET